METNQIYKAPSPNRYLETGGQHSLNNVYKLEEETDDNDQNEEIEEETT